MSLSIGNYDTYGTASAVAPNDEGAFSIWWAPGASASSMVTAGFVGYFCDTDPARHAWYFNPTTNQEIAVYLDGRTRTWAQSWTGDGSWHHLLFCWKKSTDVLDFYWDGSIVTGSALGGTWGSTSAGSQTTICARYSQDQGYSLYKFAELATFNVLPSSGNASSLAGGASPLAVFPSNTSYYWRLNGNGTATTGGQNMTITGTTWSWDTGDNPTVNDPPGGDYPLRTKTTILQAVHRGANF